MNLKEISDEELVDDVNDYDQYNDDKIQELRVRGVLAIYKRLGPPGEFGAAMGVKWGLR